MASVRVVVADDHPLWRDGVRTALGDDFWIVGEASNAEEAIAVIAEIKPDLALVDIRMPGGGIAVVRACAAMTSIVVLSVSELEKDLVDALAAGAVGYLAKTTHGDELRSALRQAAAGQPVFSPSVASMLLAEFRRLAKKEGRLPGLTDREREVLGLVARGYTSTEVAAELYLSPRTVDNHVSHILEKLRLSRRSDLIRFAQEHGID